MQGTDEPKETTQSSTKTVLVFWAAGLLVIGLLLSIWLYRPFAPKDTYGVIGLVKEVETDLRQIDDDSKASSWKVQDVELEVNFLTKVGADSKAELVAVSNDVSTEHQDTHRLTLKLHREQSAETALPSEDKTGVSRPIPAGGRRPTGAAAPASLRAPH
jgi:hypothetical protein